MGTRACATLGCIMSERTPGQRFYGQQSPTVAPEAPAEHRRGAASPGPATPQAYRTQGPLIWALVAGLAVVLAIVLVWAGTRPPSAGQKTPSPTPSANQTTPAHTPPENWQGIEFSADAYNASGYWQVSQPQWDGDHVTVTTTVFVDQGTMRFSFFALDNKDTQLYDTDGGTMQDGTVKAGESQTGTITLTIPRGDFTLYLATIWGDQVTALIISG